MTDLIAYGIIVFAIASLIIMLFLIPSSKNDTEDHIETFNNTKPTDFLVFNYFPNHSLKIMSIDDKNMLQSNPPQPILTPLVENIPPKGTKGIPRKDVLKYLSPGKSIRVYLVDKSGKETKFCDYVINGGSNQLPIKNLHIGMITTRFILRTTDNLHMTTTSANAMQGSSWLVIHNVTDVPLSLNGGEITIEPKSTTRYLGYLNQGVTLGTYFKDDNDLYPDFQYLRPHSDLYYGVVSDVQQPILGCVQTEFSDICDYGQTLWPFEEGIY